MPRHNVGHFKGERARAHFLSVYQGAMAALSPVGESADVPTSFGTVRAYRFDGPSAGRSVMLDAAHAVVRARNLLAHGQVELWANASHAINGEYPVEIAERAGRFWDDVDGA